MGIQVEIRDLLLAAHIWFGFPRMIRSLVGERAKSVLSRGNYTRKGIKT